MNLASYIDGKDTDLIVGFFDLTNYARWSAGRPATELLSMAQSLFGYAVPVLSEGGGRLIKALGDAGLFVFPPDQADRAVETLVTMKRSIDAWADRIGYPGVAGVMVQAGPVAVGTVAEQIDVYGDTVNRAALMSRGAFVIGPNLHARLSPAQARRFLLNERDEYALAL